MKSDRTVLTAAAAMIPIVIAIAVSPAVAERKNDMPASLASLIESERAFAKRSAEKGMKEAFLAFLSDDAVVFRPGPVNGHKWIGARPDPDMTLNWEPAFADVSEAGDLGYTTGPWTVSAPRVGGQDQAWGQFISVWKRQGDGIWRVALDHGISHGRHAQKPSRVATAEPESAAQADASVAAVPLEEVEKSFDQRSREKGTSAAYETRLHPDVRLYREGGSPVLGEPAALAWLDAQQGFIEHSPSGTVTATSGDLGYAWGDLTYRSPGSEKGHPGSYLRIWKKDAAGRWWIVVDIVTPHTQS